MTLVTALLDNTVLSNFALIEQAHLIHQALGQTAATTDVVWSEFETGVRLGKLPEQDWGWLSMLTLTEAEKPLYNLLTRRLNAGEASCLAIAYHRNYRVFTDDRDARALGAVWHVPVSGTLGLLVLLLDLKLLSLSEGDNLLARMIATGYRSPVTSLLELR